MPYSLSVWLDDETAEMLDQLIKLEDRTRSAMIKVLIRRAVKVIINPSLNPQKEPGNSESRRS